MKIILTATWFFFIIHFIILVDSYRSLGNNLFFSVKKSLLYPAIASAFIFVVLYVPYHFIWGLNA